MGVVAALDRWRSARGVPHTVRNVPTNDLTTERPTAPSDLRFQSPTKDDGPAMYDLARDVGLDRNSPYAYVMWGDYFASTSVVVHRGDEVVGFVAGFLTPAEPTTLFVWQIGVSGSARRLGLGSQMLDHLVDRLRPLHLEATVTPDNAASTALFRSLGTRRRTRTEVSPAYPSELLGPEHDPELRFRIGPFDA